MNAVLQQARESADPFDLDDDAAYIRWRAWKLAHAPSNAEALCIDIRDPRALTVPERAALLARIAACSTAIYRSAATDEDKSLPRLLGAQLGLRRLDANWLADEDGISSIRVQPPPPPAQRDATERLARGARAAAPAAAPAEGRGGFIPYTNRAIRWHTDGYYHPAQRRIHGMILHCVRPARLGGDSALLDHELAYIALRDVSTAHARALMQPDAMTIPGRDDEDGVARAAQTGPVFSVDAHTGSLHMRYTARTRSIEWKADAATRAAVASLEGILAGNAPWIVRTRLGPGMGIVGHNVLHERSGFDDDPAAPRLLYRARFLDRVTPTAPYGAMRDREPPWRTG
jgi:hypothetical protein